jgi:hypothetical protein
MCFSSGSTTAETPAKAPDAPLPAPEDPEIGETRKEESRDAFGTDYPTYRVDRDGKPNVAPSDPVKM